MKLSLWLIIAVVGLGNAAPLEINLPSMGESSARYLSPEEERRLGEAFLRNIRRELPFVNDPLATDYLRSLGYRIVAGSDTPNQAFDFFIVDDPKINAFAGPGGHIGVNSGLILATESESELAAVIAHEVAHVSQHHIARMAEHSARLSVPILAATLAALVLAGRSEQAGQAALFTATAGGAQLQTDFIRGNEQEADRVGILALQRAGFDPRAMAGFFERLQKNTRYFDNGALPEFLRDHPITESRLADARNRAEQFPYRQNQDSLNYHLTQARLKVLARKNTLGHSVRELKQALDSGRYRNHVAARYAYTLALFSNHDLIAARRQIELLLADDPDRLAYLLTSAEIEMSAGNNSTALAVYQKIRRLYPNHPAVIIAEAAALLQNNQPRTAHELLRRLIREKNPHPDWYQLWARAEEALGNLGGARLAVAEYLYLNGETQTALHELQKALRIPNLDFYTSSRIDARIKELEAELASAKDTN